MTPGPAQAEPTRVMFLYWGRRGFTQFAFEIATAAVANPKLAATISVSRQNESFSKFEQLGPAVFPIDTFISSLGAMTQIWRMPQLRQRLLARLREDRTQVVIELMPHVWSPLVMSAVRSAGVRYVTIIHDAKAHPGDRTSWVKGILDSTMDRADRVLTLSEAVAGRLQSNGRVTRDRLSTLFHPDLAYCEQYSPRPPDPKAPLRLLWLGRIMRYKGLPLFLDAVDILRDAGHAVEIGVFGEGELGDCAERLNAMGAEVVNRWLTEAEISAALSRFHTVVLSHTEASQSGVAATALGAGLPTIATPVGGLKEQIIDGQTGLIAARVDAPALADAIFQLKSDPELYRRICLNIHNDRQSRSMGRFVEECVSQALR
jgi:glycosyltransferase involved in cell wall biosynthesis